MVDVVRCQTSHSGHAVPMVEAPRSPVECPWCGPFYRRQSDIIGACPKCGLTPAEVAYAERIIADSTAVYVEEVRAYRANRSKGGS